MRISGITYVQRESHITRNVIVVISVLLLLSAVTISVITGIKGYKITHPKKIDIPTFSSNIAPDYKNVSFFDINKSIALKGWLFDVKSSDKTIILAHSYGKNRLQFDMKTLDMIKGFLDKNYNVLAFDFRNSGQSGGSITSYGFFEKDDLLGAVKFVKSQGSKHIVLMGFSEGAAASILALESKDVDAVIADSSYSNLSDYINSNLSSWSGLTAFPFNKTIPVSLKMYTGIDPSKVSPINAVNKIAPKPILFIHSKNDSVIPSSNSSDMYKIYSSFPSNNSMLWLTDCNIHMGSFTSFPQEYMNKVFEFLNKVYKK